MSEVTDLQTAVDGITVAVAAAVTDINTLAAQVAALSVPNPDPAAIEDAVAKLNALANNLNAAVTPTPVVAPTA